jgi:hypothetical protein
MAVCGGLFKFAPIFGSILVFAGYISKYGFNPNHLRDSGELVYKCLASGAGIGLGLSWIVWKQNSDKNGRKVRADDHDSKQVRPFPKARGYGEPQSVLPIRFRAE